jgi:hypothetical protein
MNEDEVRKVLIAKISGGDYDANHVCALASLEMLKELRKIAEWQRVVVGKLNGTKNSGSE